MHCRSRVEQDENEAKFKVVVADRGYESKRNCQTIFEGSASVPGVSLIEQHA